MKPRPWYAAGGVAWKVLDLADTIGVSSGLAPVWLLGVSAAILDRRAR